MFDPTDLLSDFPILTSKPRGQSLVYLDSAATSQKPRAVIEAISNYYQTHSANVHRGVHVLSDLSTEDWERSRATIAAFFSAQPKELIITRNTTEAINGVVYGFAEHEIQAGERIVVSQLEHHANFVPWQQLAQRKHAELVVVALDDEGGIDQEALLAEAAHKQTKIIALSHVSNVLGSQLDLAVLVPKLRKCNPNLSIVIDGAQAAPHIPVNFQALDVDFYACSGHKMLGPMGIGMLLVRRELLDAQRMRPWLFGGGMIESVSTKETLFHPDPSERFTAGTPDVASLVGMAAACEYLDHLGMEAVAAHDHELVLYALERLSQVPRVSLLGPKNAKADPARVGSVAFLYQGVHAHDVAQVLDSRGVAVRSGHHCTMPLHTAEGWTASVRASFHVYTTKTDIDALISGLEYVQKVFRLA